ncbi:MAG: acyl-CoA carboxylase epsilon subunit [Nocardioides sp.]|uniref:acyl-CoA carboxylase epsilon subunit n=1 Tax=Nocardioides sp. TaxID=35761 RepID=UPI0039E6369E
MTPTPSNTAGNTPALRVITPNATPEEVAAVVAVLAALDSPAPPRPRARSTWARPRPRPTLRHGPGAWRASGLPQ